MWITHVYGYISLFALVIRLTVTIRISSVEVSGKAVFIGGYSKANRHPTASLGAAHLGRKHMPVARLSRHISTENTPRDRTGVKDKVSHLTNNPGLRFMCALRNPQSRYLSHASSAHKCRLFGANFLRLERRSVQSITLSHPSFRPSHSQPFASLLRER